MIDFLFDISKMLINRFDLLLESIIDNSNDLISEWPLLESLNLSSEVFFDQVLRGLS